MLRVPLPYLLLKRGKPLAERIEADVLLLESFNLALLSSKLPILGRQPLSEFSRRVGLLLQLAGLLCNSLSSKAVNSR